jgi:hypothetical protein
VKHAKILDHLVKRLVHLLLVRHVTLVRFDLATRFVGEVSGELGSRGRATVQDRDVATSVCDGSAEDAADATVTAGLDEEEL